MKPISDEQLRILVAAAEGRLVMTEAVHYEIDGEERPDRRERERLVKRGLLRTVWSGPATLTPKGIDALRSAPLAEDQPEPTVQLALDAQPQNERKELA